MPISDPFSSACMVLFFLNGLFLVPSSGAFLKMFLIAQNSKELSTTGFAANLEKSYSYLSLREMFPRIVL